MKVFVAGATGVLGRSAVQDLVATGHQVRGTARGDDKAAVLSSLGAEPVSVDLFDPAALKAAVAGSEAVLCLATKIPPLSKMRWQGAWRENDRLRTHASRNLVDAAIAAGASVCVQESITFIYADGAAAWLTEDSPISPVWSNLNSTLDAERENARFSQAGGRGVALRFAAFYAPYAPSTIDTVALARRRLFPLFGGGRSYFSCIHVNDAAAAVAAALTAPAGVYNIADDEPLLMRDHVTALTVAFGFRPARRLPAWLARFALGGPAAYLLRSQRVSNARFCQATGWTLRFPSAREGWQAIAAELRR